jgi:hypothetical protein
VFVDYKNSGDYIAPVQLLIQDEYAKIFDYWLNESNRDRKPLFDAICTTISQEGKYIVTLDKPNPDMTKMIKEFVDIDIRFYDARTQTITANSQSVRKAFQKMYTPVVTPI